LAISRQPTAVSGQPSACHPFSLLSIQDGGGSKAWGRGVMFIPAKGNTGPRDFDLAEKEERLAPPSLTECWWL
jgi:hypothetical protein